MTNDEICALIKRRRLQILVHSCIYYRFGDNIITDYFYDQIGKELGRIQVQYPDLSQAVPDYYEWFKDYTPECTSGYQLPISKPEVVAKAEQLIRLHEIYNKGDKQ